MSLVIAFLIVAAAAAVGIAAMLLVRRTAPDGSYFHDGDRAAGVFGVLATGFAVLLGFVVFLAFTSYDAARAGAEAEALTVAQQVETAQFFPPSVAGELTGELVCYARSVAGVQWERMESGTLGEQINPWGVELFRTLRTVEPQTPTEQSAYDKWLDQTSAREEARSDRIHGAVGVIPTPLWLVLFFSAGLIFVFMLFFADSGERAVVQALLIGTVVAVIASMLLLLNFLNNPFHDGIGGLRPVAMERTMEIIDQELAIVGEDTAPPCDSERKPAVGRADMDWLTSLPAGLLVVGWLTLRRARRLRRSAGGTGDRAVGRVRRRAARRVAHDARPRGHVRGVDRPQPGRRGGLLEVGARHRRQRGGGGVPAGVGGDQPGRPIGADPRRAARVPPGDAGQRVARRRRRAGRPRRRRCDRVAGTSGARRGRTDRAGHAGQHRTARLVGRRDRRAPRARSLPHHGRSRCSMSSPWSSVGWRWSPTPVPSASAAGHGPRSRSSASRWWSA